MVPLRARLRGTPFALRFPGGGLPPVALSEAKSEGWRRGESNPRPRASHYSVYVRVPLLILVRLTANGQGHEPDQRPRKGSLRRPAAQRRNYPAVVASAT